MNNLIHMDARIISFVRVCVCLSSSTVFVGFSISLIIMYKNSVSVIPAKRKEIFIFRWNGLGPLSVSLMHTQQKNSVMPFFHGNQNAVWFFYCQENIFECLGVSLNILLLDGWIHFVPECWPKFRLNQNTHFLPLSACPLFARMFIHFSVVCRCRVSYRLHVI